MANAFDSAFYRLTRYVGSGCPLSVSDDFFLLGDDFDNDIINVRSFSKRMRKIEWKWELYLMYDDLVYPHYPFLESSGCEDSSELLTGMVSVKTAPSLRSLFTSMIPP